MMHVRSLGLAVAFLTLTSVSAAAPASLEDLLLDMRIIPIDAQEPPPFVVTKLEGGTVKLRDVRGQVALVYFWATW